MKTLKLTDGQLQALRTLVSWELEHVQDLEKNYPEQVDRSQAGWNRRIKALSGILG